ncbi:MAG: winged helix-turn-helix transcriptional regulator [bacterium]|nr:winged helix-turn-helix transcriptional regulator [bacterium]
MQVSSYELFEVQAEFCKTIANPKRLIIIRALKVKERTVGFFTKLLDTPIANVSQHLKALRDHDIVTTRKEGQKVFYSLTEPKLVDACDMIRGIIVDLNQRKGTAMNMDDDALDD